MRGCMDGMSMPGAPAAADGIPATVHDTSTDTRSITLSYGLISCSFLDGLSAFRYSNIHGILYYADDFIKIFRIETSGKASAVLVSLPDY